MRTQILLALMTTLALPMTVEAQRQPPHEGREAVSRRGPVELLLRNRDQLALSASQISRLEEIGQRMDLQNQPLIARLVEIRRGATGEPRPQHGTPEHQEANRRRMEEAKPLMDQIRKNNHAAMEEVGEVLTSEQKAQVKQIIDERRRRGDGRGHGDQQRRRRG